MLFMDVSSYQGVPDFARAKASLPGLKGVWVKVTQGVDYVNPYWQRQTKHARLAGLRVGFYHFATAESTDVIAEASFFSNHVRQYQTNDDLRHVLDFESFAKHLSPLTVEKWTRQWNREVQKRTGVLPLFYSYPALIQWMHPSSTIGAGLWLASYGRNDGVEHPYLVPAPWKKVSAHQFSSRCRVPGCDGYVDLSSAKSLSPLLAHPWRRFL